MKKTIRLTLLAAAAALVLTSCDAMLESLYPNETGHGTPSTGTLTVNITGYDYPGSYGYWGETGVPVTYTTYAKRPIYVDLYNQANPSVVVTTAVVNFTNTEH